MKEILFLVPARLGDALRITPALALLHQLQPTYQIDILSFGALGSSVYDNNPACRKQFLLSEITNHADFFRCYDYVVAAHRDGHVMELLSRINRPAILIDPADMQQAQAMQALNFIQSIFADDAQTIDIIPYQLFASEEDRCAAAALIPVGQKLIGFHLGCHGINKGMSRLPWRRKTEHKRVWPLKSFVLLAQEVRRYYPAYRIALTGGVNELHLAEEFMRHIPNAVSLVGKSNVQQLRELIQHFSAYVCPDTGSMHVACATDVPLITLFGHASELKRACPFPPSANRHVIYNPDLGKLSYSEVFAKLRTVLDQQGQ